MTESVRDVLKAAYAEKLVDELVAAYEEAKRNYYLGGHRLSAVEGGRFCEAAYRMLEEVAKGQHTPLGAQLPTDALAKWLASSATMGLSRSIRLYIPRALRIVYDIRNNRDAAHLADGIDPNLQDATLVVHVLDWVTAEFVRLSKGTSPEHARAMVEGLVTRKVPVVQDFGEFPKLLLPGVRAGEHILMLLHHKGACGVTYADLCQWIPGTMRKHLRRTLRTLEEKALVHQREGTVYITYAGEILLETRGLLRTLAVG
ncbi:hypothetical protein GKQ77_03455 [Streptomyces sp. BG9H]|uniref:MarR family transcriptional regulator n=1 Tax=Streptomyces anatolicus TaxID=2675858 RepID=A0ABS6YJ70_9ACTN|nr:hypothetical protein [Streptomyces anatolicus]MBW5420627.1 hypothetical protein [Streptomyces anatolicus]